MQRIDENEEEISSDIQEYSFLFFGDYFYINLVIIIHTTRVCCIFARKAAVVPNQRNNREFPKFPVIYLEGRQKPFVAVKHESKIKNIK